LWFKKINSIIISVTHNNAEKPKAERKNAEEAQTEQG